MAVTARFKVGRITLFSPTDPEEFTAKINDPETQVGEVGAEIEMVPDYAQGANKEWAYASPSGVFRISVANPAALRHMTKGQHVHIEMTFSEEPFES